MSFDSVEMHSSYLLHSAMDPITSVKAFKETSAIYEHVEYLCLSFKKRENRKKEN